MTSLNRRASIWSKMAAVAASAAVATLSLPPSAAAVDGVIEVNQASVEAGDGFPIQLIDGSYRLTSNLVVPVGTTGVVLSNATLDLNGFAIIGPGTCTLQVPYDATSIICTSGSGYGISIQGGSTLRNGRIRGFASGGIYTDTQYYNSVTIEDVHVVGNGGPGITLYQGVVRDSHIEGNGGDGITNCACGAANLGTIIERNVVVFNKGNGIKVSGLIRDNRIDYNGIAGIISSGGSPMRVNGNMIYRNKGFGINASGGGSYWGNHLEGNNANGAQTSGTLADMGANDD
ncbi:MAG TPA: right-handed parallel beta-helix repeat-containing protein [Candidatus Limnocylindrales bacterium]|nr:right-handed parallel beta-helix repeat-containing protein [Candidatus Limnocylindrales bacterium]